jgi:hypothetical protein
MAFVQEGDWGWTIKFERCPHGNVLQRERIQTEKVE